MSVVLRQVNRDKWTPQNYYALHIFPNLFHNTTMWLQHTSNGRYEIFRCNNRIDTNLEKTYWLYKLKAKFTRLHVLLSSKCIIVGNYKADFILRTFTQD